MSAYSRQPAFPPQEASFFPDVHHKSERNNFFFSARVSKEIHIIGISRPKRRLNRRKPRRSYWTFRQTFIFICIIWRIYFCILNTQHSFSFMEQILHSGTRFQLFALIQPIVKHGGNQLFSPSFAASLSITEAIVTT